MTDEPRRPPWWETIPGILTAIAAVLTAVTGMIVVLNSDEESGPASLAAPAATQQSLAGPQPQFDPIREVPPTPLNISGQWRDNLGSVYQFVQNGNAFQVGVEGTSCRGGAVQTYGEGTVTGNGIQLTYQSNLPSVGSCSGAVSPDGAQITSTCSDSVCGTFVFSASRP